MAVRQTAAEFGDGGVVVGQLLLDRQRLAVLGLRLCRLARGHQQDAEVVVAVRQCRLPVVVLRVRRGEGRLEVAGLLHRTQGLGRAADRPEEPARRIAGVGEGQPGRRVLRRAAVGGRQRRARSLVGRQRLLGFARVFQGPADGHEAAGHVDGRRRVGPRQFCQRLAARQHPRVQRQGVLLAANLIRQVGHLVVRLQQRPPRGQVGVVLQQGAELLVEVGCRIQQPVTQVLELLFLSRKSLLTPVWNVLMASTARL